MRRAQLLAAEPVIQASDLGLPSSPPRAGEPLPAASLPEPQREDVVEALARAGGVIALAARDLGLSRQALYRRMEKFGIPLPGAPAGP